MKPILRFFIRFPAWRQTFMSDCSLKIRAIEWMLSLSVCGMLWYHIYVRNPDTKPDTKATGFVFYLCTCVFICHGEAVGFLNNPVFTICLLKINILTVTETLVCKLCDKSDQISVCVCVYQRQTETCVCVCVFELSESRCHHPLKSCLWMLLQVCPCHGHTNATGQTHATVTFALRVRRTVSRSNAALYLDDAAVESDAAWHLHMAIGQVSCPAPPFIAKTVVINSGVLSHFSLYTKSLRGNMFPGMKTMMSPGRKGVILAWWQFFLMCNLLAILLWACSRHYSAGYVLSNCPFWKHGLRIMCLYHVDFKGSYYLAASFFSCKENYLLVKHLVLTFTFLTLAALFGCNAKGSRISKGFC